MPQYQFDATTRVTTTGMSHTAAAEYARGALDDALARLDERHPLGNLITGPVTLTDPAQPREPLEVLREVFRIAGDAAAEARPEIQHAALQRILDLASPAQQPAAAVAEGGAQ